MPKKSIISVGYQDPECGEIWCALPDPDATETLCGRSVTDRTHVGPKIPSCGLCLAKLFKPRPAVRATTSERREIKRRVFAHLVAKLNKDIDNGAKYIFGSKLDEMNADEIDFVIVAATEVANFLSRRAEPFRRKLPSP